MQDSGDRRTTYDDLGALPEDVYGELIQGEIVIRPPRRPRYLKPLGVLCSVIGGPFDDDDGCGGPGGWWIFIGIQMRLGSDVVRPGLAGWWRERLPDPDQRPIDVVPDWVCEVLSPSSAARDRVYKRRLYAKHGVGFYWLVDPDARTLEALELKEGVWIDAGTFDDTATARVRPFEAVEIDVGRLFLPRPPQSEPEEM